MKQFLKYCILYCIPFIVFILFYIWADPFKVIKSYDTFYCDSDFVMTNRDYGSTITYKKQNARYNYDSFIIGNSRSLFYETDIWEKYLPEKSCCFHFDESGGSVKGVHDKVVYIDKSEGMLKNVLLVLDCDLLSRLNMEGGSFLTVYYDDFLNFHKQHFIAFLDFKFLKAFIDYKLFRKYRPYMAGVLLNPDNSDKYISKTNEVRKMKAEEDIVKGTFYNDDMIKFFHDYQKPESFSSQLLDAPKISYLKEVRDVFRKHHTSYKIVISPIYNQVKLNRKTLSILYQIFGKENVYDFSGESKWTKDYHNYYEFSHYRPHVAAEIMDIIYSQPSK